MAHDKLPSGPSQGPKTKPKLPVQPKLDDKTKQANRVGRKAAGKSAGNVLIKLPAKKEVKEKKKEKFKFPSGLQLETTKDKAALDEWYDDSPTPMMCFARKFPGASEGDIDKGCLDWIDKCYINNIPVVKIRPEDLEKQISKYFKVKELVKIDSNDKASMEKAGTWKKHEKFMIHHTDGKYYWNVARIDPNLCKVLDEIREEAGFPIFVDEGVRPYAYNKDMYKARHPNGKQVKKSPHTPGRAVDLCRPRNDADDKKFSAAIVEALKGKGGGFGKGDSVFHVDTRIQHGPGGKGSLVRKKNGRITLRLRTWEY